MRALPSQVVVDYNRGHLAIIFLSDPNVQYSLTTVIAGHNYAYLPFLYFPFSDVARD